VVGAVDDRLRIALRAASEVKASDDELRLVCDAWGIDEPSLVEALRSNIWGDVRQPRWTRSIPQWSSHKLPAVDDCRDVDTTGAGDVFFAAWLARRLYQGASVEEACEHCSVDSARHVQGLWLSPQYWNASLSWRRWIVRKLSSLECSFCVFVRAMPFRQGGAEIGR